MLVNLAFNLSQALIQFGSHLLEEGQVQGNAGLFHLRQHRDQGHFNFVEQLNSNRLFHTLLQNSLQAQG